MPEDCHLFASNIFFAAHGLWGWFQTPCLSCLPRAARRTEMPTSGIHRVNYLWWRIGPALPSRISRAVYIYGGRGGGVTISSAIITCSAISCVFLHICTEKITQYVTYFDVTSLMRVNCCRYQFRLRGHYGRSCISSHRLFVVLPGILTCLSLNSLISLDL